MRKKRVIICMRYANPPAGGAEKSMLELSRILNNLGHKVNIISLGYKEEISKFNGVTIRSRFFRPLIKSKDIIAREKEKYERLLREKTKIEEMIKEFSPDIILTQHEISFVISKIKETTNPDWEYLYFIHGREYLNESGKKKINKVIENSKGVIFPSQYLKEIYKKQYSSDKFQVIHPFIDLTNFINLKSAGKSILHIKATEEKGIETTLNLAEKLPNESFIVVGKCESKEILEKMENKKNMKYLGKIDDMSKIYKKCKVLLVPTIKPETFSISSIEAQAAGCAVLTTKRGGMIINNSSVMKKKSDLEEWKRKIKNSNQRISKKKIEALNSLSQYKKLKTLIDKYT